MVDRTDRIGTIYRATCKANGKSYIGFDIEWPRRRIQHEKYSQNHRDRFHCALRKYGVESFEWDVLYQSWDAVHCLTIMEPHFIEETGAYRCGYNSTKGGEGSLGYVASLEARAKISKNRKGKGLGRVASAETRARQSASLKGRKLTEEHRQKCRDAKRPPMTEETKRKLSELGKGRVFTAETRAKLSAKSRLQPKMTDEQRLMCRERALAAFAALSPDKLDLMRKNKGKKLSAETRAKMSASHLRRRAT